MLYPKVVVISTFQVFFLAFLISYFKVQIPLPKIDVPWLKGSKDEAAGETAARNGAKATKSPAESRIFTNKELNKYDGSKGSNGLYLALLGRVYDVEKGRKHYGPGGGYHFFAGKDASRAFVSGDFSEQGLNDDITGLSHQDMIGIEEWVQFYEKEYNFVGYLQGTYYDANGRPTAKLKSAKKSFDSAHRWQQSQKAETERFPPCNSEWSQGKGGRVWCTNRSGGINRDWAGVPRKLFKPGSGQSRCACVKDSGAPQDSSEPHNDRGDLDHPNLQEYANCDPKAISCNIPVE